MSIIKTSVCPTTARKRKLKRNFRLKRNSSCPPKIPPKKDEKEEDEYGVQISFNDLEKSMTTFTGDDTYPIETFIDEFEDTAEIMKWTKVEKLIYAKRLLDGTAKLFLRSLGRVKDYTTLKKELKEEFGPKINSAIVHKKLASRKMKNEETLQQYFFSMKEMALHGKVEDAALIEYVIDGIRDSEANKVILYGATDMKEFRKKLDIYSEFRKNMSKPAHSAQGHMSGLAEPRRKTRVQRCYNCGDVDHVSSSCPKGVKCFKCNESGHKSTECTNKPTKTLNIESRNEKEKVPYKKIKISNIDTIALIDTGSDVNLIIKSEFNNIKDNIKDYKAESTCITGIAKHEVYTEGMFLANVKIDKYYTDVKFHVVRDHDIPVKIIIGNPILKDFKVNFTPDGIFVEKITHLTLLMEANDKEEVHGIEDSEYKEKIYIMCKDYKPHENEKESNVQLKILLTDEDPVYQNPCRLSPLEMTAVNNQVQIEHRPENRMKHADALSRNPICMILTEITARIKKAQYEDEHVRLTKKILQTDAYKDYIIQNEILFKTTDGNKLIVVPKNMQNEIIRQNHLKGHFGVLKTEELIRREFFIPNLTENNKRKEIRQKAKESINNIQEENIKSYKKRKKMAKEYSIGDLVAIKRTQFSQGNKLYANYLGPYEIIKCQRNYRYTVKKVGNGEGPINTTTSADCMKPWISEEEDSSESDEPAG